MKITLYENCIVNDRYNEVFHEQFFEDYLSTLSSVELDIDDTYTTFNGRLVIQHILENNKSIYKYNYMKVETDNDQFEGAGFTRYCFVDNIEIHNGYVSLDYSEDIWHSYSKGINIRNSYLTRSRQLQYGNRTIPVYRLPLPFGGNNLPVAVKRPFTGTQSGYSIVARLQTYELSSGGPPTKREAVFCVIGSKSNDIVISDITITQVFSDINNLEETLTLFETLSADKNFKTDYVSSTSQADKYFEIDDIYVIPSQFIPNITVSHTPIGSIVKERASASGDYIYEYYHCYKLVDFYSTTSSTLVDYAEVYSDTITWEGVDNFKNISVGILSNQVSLDNNGSDINFKILTGGSTYEFSILMLIQNKVVDVTNEFRVEIPFNSITGDVTAQRKIAHYMQIMSGTINTTKGIAQLIAGHGYEYTAPSFPTEAIVPYGDYSPQYGGLATETYTYPAPKEYSSAFGKIAGGIVDIYKAIRPKYLTATSVKANSKAILNCVNFPLMFQMNADNTEEVEGTIDNIGYSVDEIFNTEAINTLFVDYNVVQFDFINLYGDFPQNIANALKSILRNGVKIWYTSNV